MTKVKELSSGPGGDRGDRRAGYALELTTADTKELVMGIGNIATALWRVRTRLSQTEASELPNGLRNLPRHVDSAWDALRAAHVAVKDQTEEKYVPGMALEVIAFQPTAGLGTEVIQETIKPSVFFKDKLIQRGQVIVGTPMQNNSDIPKERATE